MKKLLLVVTMFWLFVFAGCSSTSTPVATDEIIPTPETAITEQTPTVTPILYTVQDVEAHATADSCRTIVRSQVYDLTARSSQHPGWADKIIAICGKDATPVFEKVHGGKEKPEMKLPDFYIGDLK